MFSNNKPLGEMSNSEIMTRLKPILVEIRLIQRSCEMVNFPWIMLEKFRGLSLERLQNKQKALIVELRKLPTTKLSDSEFNEVAQAAEKEAARITEDSDKVDINDIKAEIEISDLESQRSRRDAELVNLNIGNRPRW